MSTGGGGDADAAAPVERVVELDAQVWEAYFEPGPSPMAVYDSQTLGILAVNAVGRALYGYPMDQVVQMTVLDLHPPENVEARRRELMGEVPVPAGEAPIVVHRLADGRLAEMQLSSCPALWSGRPARLVTVTDVTQLRRVQREIGEEAARLRRVVALQAAIAAVGSDPDAILSLVAHGAAELVEAANASLWWVDGPRLVVRAVAGNPATFAVGAEVPIDASLAGTALRDGLIHVADTASHSDHSRTLAARTGIGSLVLAPMSHRGSPCGVLGVSAPVPNAFTPPAVEALRLAAGLVGPALRRAEAEVETQASLAALRSSENRFSRAFETSPIGMVFSEPGTGRVLRINPAMCRLVGRSPEELVGRDLAWLTLEPEGGDVVRRRRREAMAGGALNNYRGEHDFLHASGRVVHTLVSSTTMAAVGEEAEVLFSQVVDITEQHRQTGRLAHAAAHDPLTGLANRVHFSEQLTRALASAQREATGVGLLYIDLDHYKKINDLLGHHRGDAVLIEVASRLRSVVRDTDTVGRLGGDEFAVLLCSAAGTAEALAVAQRAVDALSRPFSLPEGDVVIGASVGLAHWPDPCHGPHELLHHADAAMYRAKARGGNQVELCTQSAASAPPAR